MATYYVGPGGNDGNSGVTWALRKLTLNGVEDIPVAANDTVYVGPGVYRETLTVDVSGNAGNPITYIGDVTGENTDGVGGIVRISGSDNDQATARNVCIDADTKHYRTFRGIMFDSAEQVLINADTGCQNWVLEDLVFQAPVANVSLRVDDVQSDFTVRRCLFLGVNEERAAIDFLDNVAQDDVNHLVENCVFVGAGQGIKSTRIGGITVRNCAFIGGTYGVYASTLTAGQTVTVNNSIFFCVDTAFRASVLGEVVEDYNTLWVCDTTRTNVAVGGNSVAYPPLFRPPILHAGASQASGFKFPWWFGMLSEWSQIRALTGSNEPSVDLLGIARPATASKNSWGPFQYQDKERDTGTTRGGSTASLKLADAGRIQFFVPVTAVSTTISVYVYREANYGGANNPQMIIKQPGQADRTKTDAGAASAWNQLTDTFTPAASPPYVVVELVSRNTAAAGNYDVFFDDLAVS